VTVAAITTTEAVTALIHAYGAALAECSTDAVLSLYTSDGVFMAPHNEVSVGADALRKSYNRVFGSTKLIIEFEIMEVVETSPEWAFARTIAKGTKTVKDVGTENHKNQELFVMQRVDGVWKIARYCFSSMKPLQ
jgi:uncharacterized protein (TIGR02246 family)